MTKRGFIVLPGLAIAALLVAGVAWQVYGQDQNFRACGVTQTTKVKAAFAMAHASDFWLHFPNAGKAPELEIADPAFVVVFDGPVARPLTGPVGGQGQQTATSDLRDNVVCVVIGGSPTVYSEVDLSGMQP